MLNTFFEQLLITSPLQISFLSHCKKYYNSCIFLTQLRKFSELNSLMAFGHLLLILGYGRGEDGDGSVQDLT